MKVVLDANILLRAADRAALQHADAEFAVRKLVRRGDEPVLFSQSVYEFWVVATRPLAVNGLGLSPADADLWLDIFLVRFPLLENKPGTFAEWRQLVTTHSISGKPAHDARYVAAMNTCGITHILTFNVGDFTRFPGITALDPVAIAAATTP
jgi:predicted nucleic acid-binding protein